MLFVFPLWNTQNSSLTVEAAGLVVVQRYLDILVKNEYFFLSLKVSLLELNFLPTSGSSLTKQQLILAREYKPILILYFIEHCTYINDNFVCLCFRGCPWNWRIMEHPQKRHPIFWEIHGSAEVLLLWLQVMSLLFKKKITYFLSVISSNVVLVFVVEMNFLKLPTCTSYLDWTCSSCSHRIVCLSFTQNLRDWVRETFRLTCTSGTRCHWSRCWH